MSSAYDDERWLLCANDLEVLETLREGLWSWRFACKTPIDCIAVGAAVYAIDNILSGEKPSPAVQMSLEVLSGCTDDIEIEGTDFDFSVSDEGIVLGRTKYVETGQGSSRDHHCEVVATMTDRGGFEVGKVMTWINLANHAKVTGARLSTSINFLSFD